MDSVSSFRKRVDYYGALAWAEEADARPDLDVCKRFTAWALVRNRALALSREEREAAYGAVNAAEIRDMRERARVAEVAL